MSIQRRAHLKSIATAAFAVAAAFALTGCGGGNADAPAGSSGAAASSGAESSASSDSSAALLHFGDLTEDDAVSSCETLFGSPMEMVERAGVSERFAGTSYFDEPWGTFEYASDFGNTVICSAIGVSEEGGDPMPGDEFGVLTIRSQVFDPNGEHPDYQCSESGSVDYFEDVCLVDGDKRFHLTKQETFAEAEYAHVLNLLTDEVVPAIAW